MEGQEFHRIGFKLQKIESAIAPKDLFDRTTFPFVKSGKSRRHTYETYKIITCKLDTINATTVLLGPLKHEGGAEGRRPRNKFIIARSLLSKYVKEKEEASNNDVSKITSKIWNAAGTTFHAYFEYLAYFENAWHEQTLSNSLLRFKTKNSIDKLLFNKKPNRGMAESIGHQKQPCIQKQAPPCYFKTYYKLLCASSFSKPLETSLLAETVIQKKSQRAEARPDEQLSKGRGPPKTFLSRFPAAGQRISKNKKQVAPRSLLKSSTRSTKFAKLANILKCRPDAYTYQAVAGDIFDFTRIALEDLISFPMENDQLPIVLPEHNYAPLEQPDRSFGSFMINYITPQSSAAEAYPHSF